MGERRVCRRLRIFHAPLRAHEAVCHDGRSPRWFPWIPNRRNPAQEKGKC